MSAREIGSTGSSTGISAACSARRNRPSGRASAARASSESIASASSRPGNDRPAEERPGKRGGWAPDEHRLRDRQRQQRRERRQHPQLAADAVQRDLTPRKAKDPALVDEPGRVVPALAREPQRRELELRELRAQQQPRQRLVDDDLRAPLGHARETSARKPADLRWLRGRGIRTGRGAPQGAARCTARPASAPAGGRHVPRDRRRHVEAREPARPGRRLDRATSCCRRTSPTG